jgi:hypothetical protein
MGSWDADSDMRAANVIDNQAFSSHASDNRRTATTEHPATVS